MVSGKMMRRVELFAAWVLFAAGIAAAAPGALGLPAAEEPVLPQRVVTDGTQGNPQDVVFKVNGFPVLRSEWTVELDYRRSLVERPYEPMMLPQLVKELAMRAAVMSHYRDNMPRIREKLAVIQERLEKARQESGGSIRRLEDAFGKIADELSEDPAIKGKGKGGVAGSNFPHGIMMMPFDRHVFSLRAGEISEPFATIYGYHVVMPTRQFRGHTPIDDKCDARHILVLWDPAEVRPQKRAERLLRDALVEAVDPAFRQIVPPGLQLGPGAPFVLEMPPDPKVEWRKAKEAEKAKAENEKRGQQPEGGDRGGNGDG
ncbi:MAG: peptidylprolyl isomerase [Planctomycetota bacterium]